MVRGKLKCVRLLYNRWKTIYVTFVYEMIHIETSVCPTWDVFRYNCDVSLTQVLLTHLFLQADFYFPHPLWTNSMN